MSQIISSVLGMFRFEKTDSGIVLPDTDRDRVLINVKNLFLAPGIEFELWSKATPQYGIRSKLESYGMYQNIVMYSLLSEYLVSFDVSVYMKIQYFLLLSFGDELQNLPLFQVGSKLFSALRSSYFANHRGLRSPGEKATLCRTIDAAARKFFNVLINLEKDIYVDIEEYENRGMARILIFLRNHAAVHIEYGCSGETNENNPFATARCFKLLFREEIWSSLDLAPSTLTRVDLIQLVLDNLEFLCDRMIVCYPNNDMFHFSLEINSYQAKCAYVWVADIVAQLLPDEFHQLRKQRVDILELLFEQATDRGFLR